MPLGGKSSIVGELRIIREEIRGSLATVIRELRTLRGSVNLGESKEEGNNKDNRLIIGRGL